MPIWPGKLSSLSVPGGRVLSGRRGSDPPPTVPRHNNYPITSHRVHVSSRAYCRAIPVQPPLSLNIFTRAYRIGCSRRRHVIGGKTVNYALQLLSSNWPYGATKRPCSERNSVSSKVWWRGLLWTEVVRYGDKRMEVMFLLCNVKSLQWGCEVF